MRNCLGKKMSRFFQLLARHFLVVILGTHSEILLGFLGSRAPEYVHPLRASTALRVGIVGATADVLRLGPDGLAYEGPQWFELVQEFILGCQVSGSSFGGNEVSAQVPRPNVQVGGSSGSADLAPRGAGVFPQGGGWVAG